MRLVSDSTDEKYERDTGYVEFAVRSIYGHTLSQKTQFDEFVREHEFDLALHLVCDYLISEAALITVSRMVTIDDLHAEIQILDNCISELEDARAQYEQSIET
jgi:hypothetical protein